jgi:hypothetical protein
MTAPSLEQAHEARRKLRERLAGMDGIQGIGIVALAEGYGIKVNVRDERPRDVPAAIDGVPIRIEVVGAILPL